MVVQSIYAVRAMSRRYGDLRYQLGKWYLDLPDHLRYDIGSSKQPIPQPHILTLHMQYWCTVLLLHRPLWVFSYDCVRELC